MIVDHSTTPKDHAGCYFREKSVKNLFYTQTELRMFLKDFRSFTLDGKGVDEFCILNKKLSAKVVQKE